MQFAVVHPEHEDACSVLWYKEWKLQVLQNGSHAMIELYIRAANCHKSSVLHKNKCFTIGHYRHI